MNIPILRHPKKTQPWHNIALVVVLLLAVFLHFFRLAQEGYANLYYAATVKSMLTSWHNFFFASFDPGGFVTVDKPPLGLWIQAFSAMIFGFHGWSLLLPQALAGVLSVALLYYLVARVFGPTAGVIAALVLALTPISVAANRNNTMDSLLVLTSLLAAWAVSLAAERGRLRWLLLCALLVGIGFNIKMLQAILVLPAFYLLYLVAAPLRWWKRLLHLALATVLLALIAFSWAVIVDSTPPDQRPFVGSSRDNTVMELIVGHNGAARLGTLARMVGWGRMLPAPRPNIPSPISPAQGIPAGPFRAQAPNHPPSQDTATQYPLGQGKTPIPGRSGGTGQPQPPQGVPTGLRDETGEPEAMRLFNRQLAGQISWFLPLAGLCLLTTAWQRKLSWPIHPQHQALLLWGVWLIPQVVFFSFAGLFHRYYLEMMAPAIAALLGAGLVAMWYDYRRALSDSIPVVQSHDSPIAKQVDNSTTAQKLKGWILPLALLGTAGVEVVILSQFPAWARWLIPLLAGLTLVAAIALIVIRLAGYPSTRRTHATEARVKWAARITTLGLIALLIAPAVWAAIPVLYGGHSGLPYAGPELLEKRQAGETLDVSLIADYLVANRSGETFILATINARDAAPFILTTGEAVMALGGFSGGDQILSTQKLEVKVASGEVRYFLLPVAPAGPNSYQQNGMRPPGNKPLLPGTHDPKSPPPQGQPTKPSIGPVPIPYPPNNLPTPSSSLPNQQSQLTRWVQEHCRIVLQGSWSPSPARIPIGDLNGASQLWDCGLD